MSETPRLPDESAPLGGGPAQAPGVEIAQLREALGSQRTIGMAVGLMSATYACSTEQAWRTILRVSQDSNTKVRTVARILVAVHDGTADAADRDVLRTFEAQLPPSGWPGATSV